MNVKIEKNVSLAELTTLKIGGAARFFAAPANENQIVDALCFAEKNNLNIFILGGGSNVLISDTGFDGLVLQVALKGISAEAQAFSPAMSAKREKKSQTVLIETQAGEDWDAFVKFCVERNLQGVECLSGIPGSVGGTPVQNVGAYGQEVSETIRAVRVFDRLDNQFKNLTRGECRFAYRTSIFNTTEKNRFIVTAVTFGLEKNGKPKIVYRDLQNFFGEKMPTLAETRDAVLKIRRAKSMVLDALDPNSKSAGSFFKNPIVDAAKFSEVEKKARTLGAIADSESVPHFPASGSLVKVSAAWLIEKSGFRKGYKKGNAGLSSNHTLAIVNCGDATAADVLKLKNEIQGRVKKCFGVELKPEPVFIGF